jgi:hypothetical protein
VVVPITNIGDLYIADPGVSYFSSGHHDVTPVLLATGVGTVGREDKSNRAANARLPHVAEGVCEIGMPVPHTHIDRQVWALLVESRAKSVGLSERELGDRGDAAKELVVMRHLLDASGRDTAPTQHVGQERTNVVGSFGSAETDEENRVERSGRQCNVSHRCPMIPLSLSALKRRPVIAHGWVV